MGRIEVAVSQLRRTVQLDALALLRIAAGEQQNLDVIERIEERCDRIRRLLGLAVQIEQIQVARSVGDQLPVRAVALTERIGQNFKPNTYML